MSEIRIPSSTAKRNYLTKKDKESIINEYKSTGKSREGFKVYYNNESNTYHIERIRKSVQNVAPRQNEIKAIFDGPN
jgi:hypothetical protein